MLYSFISYKKKHKTLLKQENSRTSNIISFRMYDSERRKIERNMNITHQTL